MIYTSHIKMKKSGSLMNQKHNLSNLQVFYLLKFFQTRWVLLSLSKNKINVKSIFVKIQMHNKEQIKLKNVSHNKLKRMDKCKWSFF